MTCLCLLIARQSLAKQESEAPADAARPAESARAPLFPKVEPEDASLRMLVSEAHAQSRLPQQTKEEAKLQIVDFDPTAVVSRVLREGMLPPDYAERLLKKRHWLPSYRDRQLVEGGGPDAVVTRFVAGGKTIQVVESRGVLLVFANGNEKPLDMSRTGDDALPACFSEIVRADLLHDLKPSFREQMALKRGGEMRRLAFPEVSLGPQVPAVIVSVTWTDDVLAIGMAKVYAQVAQPSVIVRKPLFADRRDERLPEQVQVMSGVEAPTKK